MFNRIWKEQISQQKGKATIWSPKEKMKPDEPDKDKCCEEVKEFLRIIIEQAKSIGWTNETEEKTLRLMGFSISSWAIEGFMFLLKVDCDMLKKIISLRGKDSWTTTFNIERLVEYLLEEWEKCEKNV